MTRVISMNLDLYISHFENIWRTRTIKDGVTFNPTALVQIRLIDSNLEPEVIIIENDR